jgi:hypothetical protein
MLNKLSRILLALVTAVVFIGQMEAAAQHCARLAGAAEAVAAGPTDVAPPCHETEQAAVTAHHGGMIHKTDAPHSGSPDACECIAALKVCAELAGATTSSHVEPYAWLAAEEASFVSAKLDLDLRPPRA